MGALIARVMVAVASIAALWRTIQRGLAIRRVGKFRASNSLEVWTEVSGWPVRLMKVLWVVEGMSRRKCAPASKRSRADGLKMGASTSVGLPPQPTPCQFLNLTISAPYELGRACRSG